jgi:hypothetical protein
MLEGIDLDGDRVADYLNIHHALMRYTHGVDRLDLEALRSAFWEDGTCNYTGKDEPAHLWAQNTMASLSGMERTQHAVANFLIEFTAPDRAIVETYCTAYHLLHAGEARTLTDMVAGGRYLDNFQKRGAQWRILSRHYVMDWNTNLPASRQGEDGRFKDLNKGARTPDDAYYTVLRTGG